MSTELKCPFANAASKPTVAGGRNNADWWPNQLNLKILHQNAAVADPMGEAFDYAEEFKPQVMVSTRHHWRAFSARQAPTR